jgi:hypothetical protein
MKHLWNQFADVSVIKGRGKKIYPNLLVYNLGGAV